jgi:hypothetical protein
MLLPHLRQHLVFFSQCCQFVAGLAGLDQGVSKRDLTMLRLGPAADNRRWCTRLLAVSNGGGCTPSTTGPGWPCIVPVVPSMPKGWLSGTV